MQRLGARIRQVLLERGISQAELARMIGAKQQTISYICGNDHQATTSRYTIKIAEALNVSARWLATGEGSPNETSTMFESNGSKHNFHLVPAFAADSRAIDFLLGKTLTPDSHLMTEKGSPGNTIALEVINPKSLVPSASAGDHLLFDRLKMPMPSDCVGILLEQKHIVVGRFRIRGDSFEVAPENPDWDLIKPGDNVQMFGTLIEYRRYRSLYN